MNKKQTKRWRPQGLISILVLLFCAWGVWPDGPPSKHATAPAPPSSITSQQYPPPKLPVSNEPPPPTAIDCATLPCLALTFDDGPDPAVTPRVLDILARYQARATFFVLGAHADKYPDLIRRIHAEGHEIGNHSWDHPHFPRLAPAEIEAQIERTQRAVMAAGVPAPHLFRPPYGDMNTMVKSHVPLALALWNVDPEDWKEDDPAKILQRIEEQAAPGRVNVMHDTHVKTADALEPALQKLKPHYNFVTVSQMFKISPGQRGEFYGR